MYSETPAADLLPENACLDMYTFCVYEHFADFMLADLLSSLSRSPCALPSARPLSHKITLVPAIVFLIASCTSEFGLKENID